MVSCSLLPSKEPLERDTERRERETERERQKEKERDRERKRIEPVAGIMPYYNYYI